MILVVLSESVEIDGSHGEGGGQLLRTAVALSAITGKPVHIKSIRAGRPNPGLQAQHLKGVEAVGMLCDAKLQGARLGSTELTFEPGEIRSRYIKVDIGTAGAITLVLQALVLAAGRVDGMTVVELTGGTHVSWSPPMDYFREVFCRHLKSLGIDVSTKLVAHGFYPRGGGRVQVEIRGSPNWSQQVLERGETPESLVVRSIASNELKQVHVAERQVDGFKAVLPGTASAEAVYVPSLSVGSAVFGHAAFEDTHLGGDALGERGVKAEQVGRKAAENLKAEIDSGASLDVHAADMMLPYFALASGPSRFSVRELSPHLMSVQWLLRHFVDVDFDIGQTGSTYSVTVEPKRLG